ncbi:MAG: hypothetical protein LUE23_06885 [Lachnospiraceae bacterium]|nr:hypothetical protein [Lachnospiraceae bacterium]
MLVIDAAVRGGSRAAASFSDGGCGDPSVMKGMKSGMKKNSFDNAEQWNAYSEQERKKHERKEKWNKRKNSFWKAFLFTKDGKPKSGFLVYTFCLSLVFLALYIISFAYVLTPLEAALTTLPTNASN